MPTENQNNELPDDALMVCPSCHHRNDPSVTFCSDCGAPLGFAATWSPFETIQAEGFALRQATSGPASVVLLAGMWLLCLPPWFAVVAFSIHQLLNGPVTRNDAIELFGLLGVSLVLSILLYKATANFIKKRRTVRMDQDTHDPPSVE